MMESYAWKAQVRLCAGYRRRRARGKTTNVVNVAIGREMVGSPGRSPARFNPRQRRRDHDLIDSQKRRPQT
jgi:hypothetical protein